MRQLVLLVVFLLLASSPYAKAETPRCHWSPMYHTPEPYYVGNPRLIYPDAVPGTNAAKDKEKVSTTTLAHAPVSASRYAKTTQAYPYGYFGAQLRPNTIYQEGYYGHYRQTSVQTGY